MKTLNNFEEIFLKGTESSIDLFTITKIFYWNIQN